MKLFYIINKIIMFITIDIEDIKYVINVDYPVQTEDYIHRIGRTARSSNLGTAYTFLTSENSRHLPKLIEVLKESNQPISDSVLNLMARTGSRMNNGRGFSSKFLKLFIPNNLNKGYYEYCYML
jgi:ATP-dependent RNA helicase DDX17